MPGIDRRQPGSLANRACRRRSSLRSLAHKWSMLTSAPRHAGFQLGSTPEVPPGIWCSPAPPLIGVEGCSLLTRWQSAQIRAYDRRRTSSTRAFTRRVVCTAPTTSPFTVLGISGIRRIPGRRPARGEANRLTGPALAGASSRSKPVTDRRERALDAPSASRRGGIERHHPGTSPTSVGPDVRERSPRSTPTACTGSVPNASVPGLDSTKGRP
jgi:hypothetical protein